MSRQLVAVAVAVCVAGALLAPRVARAQDPTLVARQHFDSGTALYKAGKFAEAEAQFQLAWDAHRSFDIAANLGDCEVEIGQYREAAEHLAYALKELPITVKDEVRVRLQTRFGIARAEVAAVRVHVTPQQATVVVNGREFSPAPDEVFIDPGPATLSARLPGYARAEAATQPIGKGRAEDVTLTLTPLPAQVIEGGPRKNVPLILVGAGVTAAGLVAGLAFTLIGTSKASSADTTLKQIEASHAGDISPCSAVPVDARCASLKQMNADADTMRNVGTVALVGTGVVAAATLTYILWPTARPAEPAATGFWITPSFSPSYGGASLRASF